MNLGLTKIKAPEPEMSLEQINEEVATVEAELFETLNELDTVSQSLEELEKVQDDIESLKTTTEKYGVSTETLVLANEGQSEGGLVCELLNMESLPEITDDNREQMAEDLIASLEAEEKGIGEKINKILQKIKEAFINLIKRIVDFVKGSQKKVEKAKETIKPLDPKNIADDIWKTELEVKEFRSLKVEVPSPQDKMVVEEETVSDLPSLNQHVEENFPKHIEIMSSQFEKRQAQASNAIELSYRTTTSRSMKKTLRQMNITSLDDVASILESAGKISDEMDVMTDLRDIMQKKIEWLKNDPEAASDEATRKAFIIELQNQKKIVMDITKGAVQLINTDVKVAQVVGANKSPA